MDSQDHMWVAQAAKRLKVGTKLVRRWFDGDEATGEKPSLDGFRLPGSGYRRITVASVERKYREIHGEQ